MKEAAGGEGFARENCILELRKEKSRDAARSRRGKENYEFYELAKMLPLPSAITSQLDKASIIRLTISYLKLRDFSAHGDPPWANATASSNKTIKGAPGRTRTISAVALEIFEDHQGTHILQSLDGFGFALGADGRFLYISETVSIYLGLSQVELTGSSIFDYIHQQDHAELAEQLGISLNQGQPLPSPTSVLSDDGPASPAASLMTISNSNFKGLDRAFCIRMKSTLTKRGCHFKSSGYRVVLVLCHLRPQYTFSHSRKHPPTVLGMVALAIALPPPSVNEVRLESDMFVTRLTFDFKIAHCEPRVAELLDYTSDELTGKNMYALCHGEDMGKLRKCHIDLIHKGQVMSSYYRIMNKTGGYTWVQMCATVVCNSKNSEEQSIICVNYVLSGIEHEHCVMDCSQLSGHGANLKPDDPSNDFPESGSPDDDGKEGLDPRDGNSSIESPRNDDEKPAESGEHLTQLSSGPKPASLGSLVASPRRMAAVDKEANVGGKSGKESLSSEANSDEETKAPTVNARKRRRYREEEDRVDVGSGGDGPVSDACGGGPDRSLAGRGRNSIRDGVSKRACSPSLVTPTSPRSCDGGKDAGSSPKQRTVGSARSWKFGSGTGNGEDFADDVTNASVKDLEDAMNKHLPLLAKESSSSNSSSGDDDDDKRQQQQQQRSTIQWIGAQQGGAAPLPASTLLRQLYANRESVIRSNVHSSRPAFFPGDLQGTLPTPPSGDGVAFGDQAQFVLPSKLGPHSGDSYAAAVLSAGYASAAAAPVTSYADSYGAVTPPSSVSPRDKLHPAAAFPDGPLYGDVRHFASGADAAPPHLQPLPLKPQAYAVHPGAVASLDAVPFPAHAQQTLGAEHPQQFYAHHGSGFHIYHPTANKVPTGPSYVDDLKNGTGWYPPANS